ncbi:hypothetical protein, conserved [Eimeria acervulina]|uniref:Uncharacterized protein n=1 Tax=Eimeria acervulina TaxID=5801 RepID=U6GHH1_EIMAC|nr:hypothetical protein, conserved [Eimeria acervulina]CDI79711.1 hypothetical protein, conserved [Eimeria acervulina]
MLSDSAIRFQQEKGFNQVAPSNNVSGPLYSTAGRTDLAPSDTGCCASVLSDAATGCDRKADANWARLHNEHQKQLQMTGEYRKHEALSVAGKAPMLSVSAEDLLAQSRGRIGERNSIPESLFQEMLPCMDDPSRNSGANVGQYHLEGERLLPSTGSDYPVASQPASLGLVLQEATGSHENELNLQNEQNIPDGVLGSECSWLRNPEDHPFVRLPILQKDVVPRTFKVEEAFASKLLQNSPMSMYLTMRELFSKQSLNARDAQNLVFTCERLVNYGIHRLTTPLPRYTPFLISRRLANLLMMFDYVVCTAHIIGPKMGIERWWQQFVNLFRMDRSLLSPPRVGRLGSDLLVRITYRLIDALEIYRTGGRPSALEIIQLKRLILCHLRAHSQFEHPHWVRWVEDDEEFLQKRRESSS